MAHRYNIFYVIILTDDENICKQFSSFFIDENIFK